MNTIIMCALCLLVISGCSELWYECQLDVGDVLELDIESGKVGITSSQNITYLNDCEDNIKIRLTNKLELNETDGMIKLEITHRKSKWSYTAFQIID